MRLHEVTNEQVAEWMRARSLAGRKKYGDAHLQRHNLVDIAEELLDAINILFLFDDRFKAQTAGFNKQTYYPARAEAFEMWGHLNACLDILRRTEAMLPEHLITDEQGGERVWWSEQQGEKEADRRPRPLPFGVTYEQENLLADWWVCKTCGYGIFTNDGDLPFDEGARFCGGCGRPIVVVLVCLGTGVEEGSYHKGRATYFAHDWFGEEVEQICDALGTGWPSEREKEADPAPCSGTVYVQTPQSGDWECQECVWRICEEVDNPFERYVRYCAGCGRRITEVHEYDEETDGWRVITATEHFGEEASE